MGAPITTRISAPPQRAQRFANAAQSRVPYSTPSPTHRLQRAVGNRATNSLLRSPIIQPKLSVSHPDDPYEREADDVADKVMRMVEPGPISGAQAELQRKCTKCEEGEEPTAVVASLQGVEGSKGESSEFELTAVQRKAEFSAPPFRSAAGSLTVADRLAGTQSGGELLASGTRHPMEAAFGRDFSRVRVHHDKEAAELSRQVSALAFTHGNQIYFGSGKFDPEGSSGKRLLAHELTHVVQQGQAAPIGERDTVPTATAAQTKPPAIQRVATWRAATVHQTNNLANTALDGTEAGVTAPMFNGTIIRTIAAAQAALNGPTVNVSAAASGGFDATVTAVPRNTGSADETVLGRGPWRRVAPRATIGALFPTLAQCTGAGDSRFRASGQPSDAHMFAANRRHENRHVRDARAAFNGSVVPWDRRLTAARRARTTFHGATDADARTALFAAMGGTGDQVSDAFAAAVIAARDAYHATPAGGTVGAPTNPRAARDCSWSSARYHNPS